MVRPIKVKLVKNKKNGQFNISLPKKKLSKKTKKIISKKDWLNINILDL